MTQTRTNTPRCTLLMTQTRTNTPRCTLWVAQARVNTPQCYFKVCRAGRTPYLYSSREFTEHLRTFLKIQKNCVLRALLPFGGHLATFHKDAFRFLHRNSSYICLNCTFSFFTSALSFSAQRNVIKGSGGLQRRPQDARKQLKQTAAHACSSCIGVSPVPLAEPASVDGRQLLFPIPLAPSEMFAHHEVAYFLALFFCLVIKR